MATNLQTTQVKLTLPNELYFYLKSKANKFGLTMSSYIRHLAINDVKDMDLPVFKMSDKTENVAIKASKDFKKGNIKKIIDIDKYLDSL